MVPGVNPRPTRRFIASGVTYEIQQAPPRRAFKAALRLIRVLGPALAGLVTGAGIDLGDGSPPITWDRLIGKEGEDGDRAALWLVVNELLRRTGQVEPDEVLELLDGLTMGCLTITLPGANPVTIERSAQLDALMPDPLALFNVLRYALEVNLRPTSPAESGPMQTATTQATPSAT